ncbi:uncharacterized protein LOC134846389 [Symsagittifera roscoffensis]|uniref:uncharacterized protein LOC134846389 n=1 Tax=Symsagittifera roscoffensis TaxID=84072 RepID=UPI00307B92F7
MLLNKTLLGGVGLALLVCSFFFSCFAHSNYGFTYDYLGETIHGGIWTICYEGNCDTHEELGGTTGKLLGARTFIVTDHLLCFPFGILLILVLVLTEKTGLNLGAALCSLVHFFLLLLTSSLMSSEFSADGLVVGWGTGLTWFSWIISLFLLIDLGFLVFLSYRKDNETPQPQMSYNPQGQGQVMQNQQMNYAIPQQGKPPQNAMYPNSQYPPQRNQPQNAMYPPQNSTMDPPTQYPTNPPPAEMKQ